MKFAESKMNQIIRNEKQRNNKSEKEKELENLKQFTGMDKWQQHRAIEKLKERAENQTRRINSRREKFRKLKEDVRGLKGDGGKIKKVFLKTENEKDEDDGFNEAGSEGSGSFEKGDFLESSENNDSYKLNNYSYIN